MNFSIHSNPTLTTHHQAPDIKSQKPIKMMISMVLSKDICQEKWNYLVLKIILFFSISSLGSGFLLKNKNNRFG